MSDGRWELLAGTRREFLGQLGRLGAAGASVALSGTLACARSVAAPSATPASARRTRAAPEGGEILEAPLILGDGDTLVDRVLVVSEHFRNTPDEAIVRVAGNGVKIRNVRIVGADSWQARWNDPSRPRNPSSGTSTWTVGFRIENVRDVSFEQVEVEGLPRAAIFGYGIQGGEFRDLELHHCYHGMQFFWKAPNRNIHIERVHARDMWGPPPGTWDRGGRRTHAKGFPSRKRPGGYVGGDGLVLNTLRDAVVADCTAVGEFFGSFKMTNPQRLEVRGLRGGNIHIQGTADREWKIHKTPAHDVRIHDCLFDKGLIHGPNWTMNCIQISQNVADVRVENCRLIASGKGGHAIQAAIDSHATVVGCTIEGFNGRRGRNPAHAIHVVRGSTVNDDFEQVNTFVDQQRIRLELQPGRRPARLRD